MSVPIADYFVTLSSPGDCANVPLLFLKERRSERERVMEKFAYISDYSVQSAMIAL